MEINDANQHKLSDVIKHVLKNYRLEDKLDELQLSEAWEQVLGKTISGCTDSISLKNGVLRVKLNSASLRNELNLARQKLIAKLNEAVGREIIRDIYLR